MCALSSVVMLLFAQHVHAYDCSQSKPFSSGGKTPVQATVARYVWSGPNAIYQDVCKVHSEMDWYDVRGREEEAYYCLKPTPGGILTCATEFQGEAGQITILPASWVRTVSVMGSSADLREYRFHAYIAKISDPDFAYDIFSRSLTRSLSPQETMLEGSLRTGPSNPYDGFWVRVEFGKASTTP